MPTHHGGDPRPVAPTGADARARAVELIGDTLTLSGMPRMPSRTFAAILVSDQAEVTAAEVADLLRASPAAVSGAVRYLEQVEMIRRSRPPGSRRDHFTLGDDVWYETFAHKDALMRTWESTMSNAADTVGRGTPAGRRLAESGSFFAFLATALPELLQRWKQERERYRAGHA